MLTKTYEYLAIICDHCDWWRIAFVSPFAIYSPLSGEFAANIFFYIRKDIRHSVRLALEKHDFVRKKIIPGNHDTNKTFTRYWMGNPSNDNNNNRFATLYKMKHNIIDIYTTIAALSAKICPQNRTDFYPYGLNSTPIIA